MRDIIKNLQDKEKDFNRVILYFFIICSVGIFYVLRIRYLLKDDKSVRVFYVLFAGNELVLFVLLFAVLAIVYFITNYKINLLSSVQHDPAILSYVKRLPAYLSIITFIVTLAGTYLIFHNYALCMDEYAPEFQAVIFLSGKLRAVLAQPWQGFADALSPIFIFYNPASHSWYQVYLPVYAAVKAIFLKFGAASATNPVMAALSVIVIGRAAANIWPREEKAPLLAMILLMSSSQFLITSMTAYTMPAHLLLNLLWLYCYTHKRKHVDLLLPIIGVIALGVHNPFVHALFVTPFLLRILRERPWKFTFYVGAVYLLGCLAWFGFWKFVAPPPALESNSHAIIFSFPEMIQGLIQPMNLLLTLSWQSLAITLLAFFAVRNWGKLAPLHRDLLGGGVLTFVFYFFFAYDQGHGWGYRYIYGVLGNLVLLAIVGWYELREAIGAEKAVNFLIVTLALALFIQLPIRGVQAETFVRPFASAERYLQNRPESFMLLDETQVWYSQDLIRNDPFLRNSPKFFASRKLSSEQVALLEKLGTIHRVAPEELVRFGLIRMEPRKIDHDQAKRAGR